MDDNKRPQGQPAMVVDAPGPLTQKELLAAIADIDDLSVVSREEGSILLWDSADAKYLPVHFLEGTSPSTLAKRIHISKDIPSDYQVDQKSLAKYLWDTCDRNSFITLQDLVVIWSESDEQNPFAVSDFVDEQCHRMAEEYCDEYAYEIGSGVLGQLWFERNVVVVNMGEIVRCAQEIAKKNRDLPDPFFSLEHQVFVGFLTTALHELRHLQLDTNIFLSEDDYPILLGSEQAVEDYCRERFETSSPNPDILPNLFQDEGYVHFPDSQIICPSGKLMVLYHGSKHAFTRFRLEAAADDSYFGRGIYFTANRDLAATYAGNQFGEDFNGFLYEVHLNIKNPYRTGVPLIYREEFKGMSAQQIRQTLIDRGYDGVAEVHWNGDLYEQSTVVAFYPEQIEILSVKQPEKQGFRIDIDKENSITGAEQAVLSNSVLTTQIQSAAFNRNKKTTKHINVPQKDQEPCR